MRRAVSPISHARALPRFVAATAEDGPLARATLSPLEHRISAGMPSTQRRQDYRAGRLAARRALSRLTPESEPVVSVAHRDGLAVAAAVAGPGRVGVDLERRAAVALRECRLFLTPVELALALRGADATLLWALKESAWKALTLTADVPFHDLELCFAAGRLAAVRLREQRHPASAAIARPWPGYVATVVTLEGVQ